MAFAGQAQDTAYVKAIVRKLTAPDMDGRGYVNKGGKKAAEFISNEFRHRGLRSLSKNYFQKFTIPMNIFTDSLHVRLDGKELVPGFEYVISASSPSVQGEFELVWDTTFGYYKRGKGLPRLHQPTKNKLKGKVVLTRLSQHEFTGSENPFGSVGIISLSDKKLSWHVSDGNQVNDYFTMSISKDALNENAKKLYISARAKFQKKFTDQNVVGYIPGKTYPDSFFVFTAHYDHLGRMGKRALFPGGNDNASGTSMLLDLAHYYSLPENQSQYSILFIAFGAEEAGLLGSFYFTNHPLIPLDKMVFLINLDMVGSGSEGIKVVNGTVFKQAFERLKQINTDQGLLKKVGKRGAAANSDHYPFYEKGVPCFFIYTLGPECPEYHSVYDTPDNVPFTEYSDLFHLLTTFVREF